jgi:hypothetical protein
MGNQLMSIDVTAQTALTRLNCSCNNMADKSAVIGFTGSWDGTNFIFDPQNDGYGNTPEPTPTPTPNPNITYNGISARKSKASALFFYLFRISYIYYTPNTWKGDDTDGHRKDLSGNRHRAGCGSKGCNFSHRHD